MNRISIGLLFVLAGIVYGSLAKDNIYARVLTFLAENKLITPPVQGETNKEMLGRKSMIVIYSLVSIIIGLFLLWNYKI